MQKEDIDEFIDVCFVGDKADIDRQLNFLNRMGIHDPEALTVEKFKETVKQIAEKIRSNRELVEYLKTKDKETLGLIAQWIPEVFDEEYLKKMIAEKDEYGIKSIYSLAIQANQVNKKFIESGKENGFSSNDIVELVLYLNDKEYTKEIIERRQEYGLSSYDVAWLVKSINDIEYTKEIIERWQEYGLSSNDIVELVLYLNDKEYTKGIIKRWQEYGLSIYYLIDLVKSIDDTEYIKEIVKRRQEYGLDSDDLKKLLTRINDTEIIIKEIIEKWQEYGLNDDDLSSLVLIIDDKEYTKEIIERWEEYGLDGYYLAELVKIIDDKEYTKEIIEVWQVYGLSSNDVAWLVKIIDDKEYTKGIIKRWQEYGLSIYYLIDLVKSIDDTEYIKEIVKRRQEYGLDSDDLKKLLTRINDTEIIIKEIIEKWQEYGLNGDDLSSLVLIIGDKEYTKEIIERWPEYGGFSNDDLTDLIIFVDDPEYTKKIIERWPEYGFSGWQLTYLVDIADDPEYTKEIIERWTEYGLSIDNLAVLVDSIDDTVEKLEILKKLNDVTITKTYRMKYASPQFIKTHLKEFLEMEKCDDKEELILEMAEENEDILKSNYDIITDKYIQILGKDKVNLISCYPYIAEKVKQLSKGELTIFGRALDSYLQKTNGEEWTPLANRILDNIASYGELISNLEGNNGVDIDKLIPILIHPNDFDMKTIEDVENFREIKRKRCEELINGETLEEKRKGVLLKIFGQTTSETKLMIEKFGEDIDQIGDEDLKAYIKSLEEILNIKNPKTLENIFEQVEGLETTNPLFMERMLKTEYWKLYNKDLFKIENAEKLPDEENVYSAGTDFKMIITSVGAYVYTKPDNYKEDWNRPSFGSQHFCASYIRNDMLGHAPVPHICYGFEEMKEDSLMLSGPGDMWSSGVAFESIARRGEQYLAPDSQIKNTYGHNEMDFRRMQDGEKKQPDYIVVFKENGKIPNMDEAQIASRDFGGLPIVVIDVEKCLESERRKAEELFEEYKKTGDPNVRKQLQEKLRNNRVTDRGFCKDTDMDRILENSKEQEEQEETKGTAEVSMEDLDEIYGEVTPEERQEETGRIKAIYEKIKNIKGKEEDSVEK